MVTEPPPASSAEYLNRTQAESFGSVAADYDRYRPTYPDDLIAELVNRNPANALDIGCGTGKLAVPLLACGVGVLGVEIDPQMAAVAASHGIVVEIGSFEDWDADGRRFDLATCGQAWHWIDPVAGPRKAGEVLNPGGTLALVWNYYRLDADVERELEAVYREHAPELRLHGGALERHIVTAEGAPVPVKQPYVADLRATGVFAGVDAKKYRWERTFTTDEWLSEHATHSDHIVLDEPVRAALFAALRAAIERRGGELVGHYTTYGIFARTPE